MLDNERGPNREGGCQTCYGAVTINKPDYKTILKNAHYYIISHLSSVVKTGATRIGTTGDQEAGITYAAFENTDGSYAMVMMNNSNERKEITIGDGKNQFNYVLPSKAVASFQWISD